MHLETGTARVAKRVSAKVATETTVEDNAGNKAAIETIEAAVNKVATEVVEPSTTTIGPVPVATT